MAELTLYEFENSFVWNIARSSDQQMIGSKPFAKAALQRFTRELANCFRSAENRAAERMLGPEAARKNFVQQRFRVVEIHLDLFQNDLALLCHVFGIEKRTETQVGNDVEGNGQMVVEHLRVEANLLFRSEGVEHAADGIHFA